MAGAGSIHHVDVAWCVIGNIQIMYHASLDYNIQVSYQEETVFGSHGVYAVWTGTSPRSFSLSSNLVAANSSEVLENLGQVRKVYNWTQESPPQCKMLSCSAFVTAAVRIESFNTSIEEGVLRDGGIPIQIALSMEIK